MIRILGAALIAGCGCWMGERKARTLRERERVLKELSEGLEQLRRELELLQTPLPQLFRRLEQTARYPMKELFSVCADWTREEREGISFLWREQVDRLVQLAAEDRYVLASLGEVLGRYPAREQGEAIRNVCVYLKQQGEGAEQAYRRMGKVYRGLGAASGGLLVILLL